jgi:hypothetical protein
MTATWSTLLATLQAGAEFASLPPATFHRPDTILAVAEVFCDTVTDGDAWAGWLDTDPQPFAGRDAVCWLAERGGWVVVVSAPVRVLAEMLVAETAAGVR